MESSEPTAVVRDCSPLWLTQDLAWHDADMHGRDERLAGPISRPYCYAALPSTLEAITAGGLLPRGVPQRFAACALSSLFGHVSEASDASRMVSSVHPAQALTPQTATHALKVVLHVRVGNSVWVPTHKDVRTSVPPSEFAWKGFFECAKATAAAFLRRSGVRRTRRQLRLHWYVATDWSACLANASAVLGTDGNSVFLTPIEGEAILSGSLRTNSTTAGPLEQEHLAKWRRETHKVFAEHTIMAQADLLLFAASSYSATAAMISLLPALYVPFSTASVGETCEVGRGFSTSSDSRPERGHTQR
jgi:hypothetical protein